MIRVVHAVEPNACVEVDLDAKLGTVTGAGAEPDRIFQTMVEAGYPAGGV